MTFMDKTKQFFGLTPVDVDPQDAYYDDDYRDDVPVRDYGHSYDAGARYSSAATAAAPIVHESRKLAPTIVSVTVNSFNDAIRIGEPYRDGDAVVFDLTALDRAEAKRVIDFAAGLTVALDGKLDKISRGLDTDRLVFGLQPSDAAISLSDMRRAARLI